MLGGDDDLRALRGERDAGRRGIVEVRKDARLAGTFLDRRKVVDIASLRSDDKIAVG